MSPPYKYKAFISYSHADRKWGEWLHKKLEAYRVPKRLVGGETPARLTPIFRDRDELASSPNLSERIQESLESSENLIVICSPNSAKSKWVDQEITTFKRLGRSDRIFSLIIDGDPGAIGLDDDCFPPSMRTRVDSSGELLRGQTEPIGADVRSVGDGRGLAFLKIVAGIIDVGLDDLRQRELQRRQKRMVAITTGSLAIATLTIFLAITAILSRNESNQRRAQAEDLLGFMVGDLRDNLAPIGRLDLLEEVGARAMDYFDAVDLDALTAEELSFQARVITQLGEIKVSQLQFENALNLFTQAYERSKELYEIDPGNGDRLFARGQAEFWVGYVHWQNGDLSEARNWLSRYRESCVQLTKLDPTRMDWAQEAVYGHHNLAVLNLEDGNLDAALAALERELEDLYSIQAKDPGIPLTVDIADAISWIGNVALARGDLPQTLAKYEQSARQHKTFSQEAPDDTVRQFDWANAAQRVTEIYLIMGELDKAIELADEAIRAFNSLTAYDEENSEWQRASAIPRVSKAFALASANRFDEARELARQAIDILEDLKSRGIANLNVHEHLANAYDLMTWISQANDDNALAMEFSQLAMDSMKVIVDADRLNDERIGKLALLHVVRGELLSASGDSEGSERAWQRASDLLSLRIQTSRTPYLLDPWIRVLTLTGQSAQAAEWRNVLRSSQYIPPKPWPR